MVSFLLDCPILVFDYRDEVVHVFNEDRCYFNIVIE
jgi:hypothetical protein